MKSDAEWREKLSPEAYRILRQKGTEAPHTGKYADHFQPGTYHCAGCGAPLFSSRDKYDAGCGWPSFTAACDDRNVDEAPDHSLGMERTEVLCAACGGHLGHVFPDGPRPTGRRYCINSAALDFREKD
ncbi:MAG: peptide-methionine (R)-S-oxide reductase MsrB [Patescibacteria group bacterium]